MAKSSSFSSGFNEGNFRNAIKNTMLMGIPEDPAQQLKWWWHREQTFSPDDPSGATYDWTASPVTDKPGNPDLKDDGTPTEQHLVVPYALEYAASQGSEAATVFGGIDTSRATISMAEVDYEQIKTADYCTVGDTSYRIQFTGPPIGLFGFTLWQVFIEAEDSA